MAISIYGQKYLFISKPKPTANRLLNEKHIQNQLMKESLGTSSDGAMLLMMMVPGQATTPSLHPNESSTLTLT